MRLVALLGAGVVLMALAGCSPGASAALTPGQVFEASKPAVVIVETDNAVTWSVPQPALTAQKAQQLRAIVVAMVRSGQVANNQAAIAQASLNLLVANPDSWFTAGAQRHQQTDSVLQLGTGFFVTQDGYLVTNDHVVEISSADVQQQLLDVLQRESGDPRELAAFRDETSRGLGAQLSDAQASKLFQWMLGVFKSDVRVASVTPTYRIGFGSMSPADVQSSGQEVQLVAHGQTTPGRDVAVLRAPGGPFVSLPTESSLPGDRDPLSVIGYPCSCTAASASEPAQVLKPVLTTGAATGVLAMPGGWSALATTAHIEHGNSGGPVLDSAGRVVGLATFSDAAAPSTPRSFAVPTAVAAAFIAQAHVQAAQGPLGQRYAQAVAEFDQGHFRTALPLFEQVAAAEAHDVYARQYVTASQAAIAAGQDRTPLLGDALPVIAVAVYVAVSAIAVTIGVVVYRRRRRLLRGW